MTAFTCVGLIAAALLTRGVRAEDSSILDQQNQNNIVFKDLGTIFRTHTTVHVSISVDLRYLKGHCSLLKTTHDRPPDSYTFTPRVTRLYTTLERTMDQVCRQVDELETFTDDDQSREKRQLLSAIAVGVTSIFGLYTAAQVHRLDQRVQAAEGDQRQQAAVLRHQSQYLLTIEKAVQEQDAAIREIMKTQTVLSWEIDQSYWVMDRLAHVQELATYVAHLTNGVEALRQGHLTTAILSRQDARRLLTNIKAKAEKLGGKAIAQSREDLYRLPITVINVQPMHLRVLLHVGVAREQLRLLRYQPGPMVLAVDDAEVTIEVRPDRTLMAHNDHLHQELSEAELASCNRKGSTYICDGPAVFHTQLRSTCMGALFANDLERVKQLCPVRQTNISWNVQDLGQERVAIYFRERTNLQLSCPDKQRTNTYLKGASVISIPANCSVLGDNLRIDAHADILMSAPTTTQPRWNLSEFLEGHTVATIHQARRLLQEHHVQPADDFRGLAIQEERLRQTSAAEERSNKVICALVASLALNGAIVAALVLRLVLLVCQRRRGPADPVAPAAVMEGG